MKGNDLAASSGDATVMRFRSPPRFTRRDPDCFVEEGEVWEIEYKVSPDGQTMTVRQTPYIDNGFVRWLVYERLSRSLEGTIAVAPIRYRTQGADTA